MPNWGYSTALAEGENAAKASAREVDVSPKWAREVCEAIKGLKISEARALLERVVERRELIPYKRYRKKRAHHAQTRGPGGYPVKVARIMLKLLDGLEANAEFKGLDLDRVKIVHASAHKGRRIRKYIERAFGRSSPYHKTLTHIELVAVSS
ncbi:MAG: 50S ribosomal protein L22 [Nitrososphaerota archaeon]